MPSTTERLQKLVVDNLEVDGKPISMPLDMNSSLVDIGVSSMDIVAFARVVQQEFNMKFEAAQCTELTSLNQLVESLDANS